MQKKTSAPDNRGDMQQSITAQDNPHGQTSRREGKDAPRQKDFRARAWHLFPPEWAALAVSAFFLAYIILRPGPAAWFKAVADLCELVGPCLAAAWCLGAVRRACPGSPRLTAAFMGAGALSFGIGQAVWSWYEIILRRDCPFPSGADAAYLAAYPFLLASILLLPRRPLPPALRGRGLLDGLMVMAGIVTLSWYFVLGPMLLQGSEAPLLQGSEAPLGKVIGMAYPLADIGLLFCLLVFASQDGVRVVRRETVLLGTGLLAIIVADTAFGYKTLHGTYHTGSWSDLGWITGYMLVGSGGYALAQPQGTSGREQAELVRTPVLWRSLVPLPWCRRRPARVAYAGQARDERLERGLGLARPCCSPCCSCAKSSPCWRTAGSTATCTKRTARWKK